jgi:TonB family protein
VVVALAVHGAVLGTVHALGLSLITDGLVGGGTTKPSPDGDDAELKVSCFNDAMFATSGRAAMCLAPWVHDVDRCIGDAQMALWMDLSSCQGRADPGIAIAMVDVKATERLKPIDPEKLLEELMPEARVPPPPPPPPPPQLAAAQPPPPPPPAPPPNRPQQVIETVKPNQEKEPENTRFLAEYNTSAEKQKVSRGARNEPMVAKAKPEELTPKAKPKDEPSVQHKEPDRVVGKNPQAPDVPGRLSMRNPGALFPSQKEQEAKTRGAPDGAAPSAASDGYAQRKGDGAIDQDRRERSEMPRGQNGAGGGAPEVPNLKPTEDVLERALGGGSVDHLEDVENSDETSLSAKRWVYASFFNRMKRQVAQNWDPNSVWRRADPTGTVYGTKTRVTEVRVSLSAKGDLVKILVISPSGSVELDEEARRAFQVAAPFPNPPDGLVQKDNLITFGFAFYFTLGVQHLTWRLPQAM